MIYNLVIIRFIVELRFLCQADERTAAKQDEEERKLIATFPASKEKRVISFGLYGSSPKYVTGAIKNARLAKVQEMYLCFYGRHCDHL